MIVTAGAPMPAAFVLSTTSARVLRTTRCEASVASATTAHGVAGSSPFAMSAVTISGLAMKFIVVA